MTTPIIHGYSDKISALPGESIRFLVSCDGCEEYQADLVRLIHGDTNPDGIGFQQELIDSSLSGRYPARHQVIHSGSYVRVDDQPERISDACDFTLHAFIWPTTPTTGPQGLITKWAADRGSGAAFIIDEKGALTLLLGDGSTKSLTASVPAALNERMWYSVGATYDATRAHVSLYLKSLVTPTNALRGPASEARVDCFSLFEMAARTAEGSTGAAGNAGIHWCCDGDVPILLAAFTDQDENGRRIACGHYNGKMELPRFYRRVLSRTELDVLTGGGEPSHEGLVARWDFGRSITSKGISSGRVIDSSGSGLHGVAINMPTRGVAGRNWTGEEHSYIHAPKEYGAIHFHDDDLEDACWEIDFEFRVPNDLNSDVYAARLSADDAEDYIPFVVRPGREDARAPVVLLLPTATYLAYANERSVFDAMWTDTVDGRLPVLNEDDLFLNAHTEYGLSLYDLHSDSSGVCYSSRLRPIINMRPGYRHRTTLLEEFPADLCIVAWLNRGGLPPYDVVTDEDLHREGTALLQGYRAVITGTHPEYYTSRMLDSVGRYVATGGRLMYLGGNGFYWVCSFDPEKPHVMEVRRGESGTRPWQADPGEYHHSTTGERGGLWRYRGRTPQKLVGVGFAAQGFDRSTYFRRLPDSNDPRVAFIFDGVEDEVIGDFGKFGGGAAGQEVDRYDLRLGTPAGTFLLASSEDHTDGYRRVVEELPYSVPAVGGTEDPDVRADMVYFVNERDGAVFSVGSMAWCGSLEHNNYANSVARISENVLRRFVGDGPLPRT